MPDPGSRSVAKEIFSVPQYLAKSRIISRGNRTPDLRAVFGVVEKYQRHVLLSLSR